MHIYIHIFIHVCVYIYFLNVYTNISLLCIYNITQCTYVYYIYIPWITPMMVAQLRLFQALICKSMWPLHSRLGERSRCRWNHWFECCWGHPARVFWGLNTCWLVVWNIWLIFPYIGNVIIPTDFHIFPEGLKPPTSCSIQEYLVITVVA